MSSWLSVCEAAAKSGLPIHLRSRRLATFPMRKSGLKRTESVLNRSHLRTCPRSAGAIFLSALNIKWSLSKHVQIDTFAVRQEGSLVLALHRSQRSDLFFEGTVTDSGPSSYCKVKFTEGRAKGSTVKVGFVREGHLS